MQRVLDDPGLIRPMLDESLRIESPFHLTEMICEADTEIAGVPIPAGAAVYKVWGSGNRDEGRFSDPDAFRIRRPGIGKTHLGFGRGSHRCLGAPLALLEGTIAFEVLLSRCRNIRFAPDQNDWTHVHAVSFRSLNRSTSVRPRGGIAMPSGEHELKQPRLTGGWMGASLSSPAAAGVSARRMPAGSPLPGPSVARRGHPVRGSPDHDRRIKRRRLSIAGRRVRRDQ